MPSGKVSPGQETQGDHAGGITSHWGRYGHSHHGDGRSGPGEKDAGEPGPERTQTVLVEEEGHRGEEGRKEQRPLLLMPSTGLTPSGSENPCSSPVGLAPSASH